MNAEEKVKLVHRAIWENVRRSSKNEVVVSDQWVQLTTPGAPTPVMNGVFRCEIESDRAEEHVRKTIAAYREKGLPFRWKTCESTKPVNIESLLKDNGLQLKDLLFGVIALPGHIELPENLNVNIRPLSPELKEDWITIQRNAWKVPQQGLDYIRKNFENESQRIDKNNIAYLAYVDGVPVASAGLLIHKDYVFLVGAATAPDYRGKGVYKALLRERILKANELNLPVVNHCVSNTSAPICLKLGFEKVCEIKSYEPT